MERSWVSVDLTHNLFPNRRWASIRLDASQTIQETKDRLYRFVGTNPTHMQLFLIQEGNESSRTPLRDEAILHEYGPFDSKVLHIVDVSEAAAPIDEEKLLMDKSTKFVLDDEEYDKRSNSMRNFIKMQRSKQAATSSKATDNRPSEAQYEAELREQQAQFPIDSRCEVQPGGLRGTIKFVGQRKSKSDARIWIGVSLDEPLGNTNGLENGIRMIECSGEKYGHWALPQNVTIGDFPAINPLDLAEL